MKYLCFLLSSLLLPSMAAADIRQNPCQVAAEVWASQEITAKHTNDMGPIENLNAQGINISIDQIRRSSNTDFCEQIVEAQLHGFRIVAGRDNVEPLCEQIFELGRAGYMQMFIDDGFHRVHAFHLSKFQTFLCMYEFPEMTARR